MTRVFIMRGKFQPADLDCWLEWQIYNQKGEPVEFDYRGEAGVDGNQIRIPSGAHVYDYTISETPTPESVQTQKGYEMAMRQNRKRCPGKQSSWFIHGWQIGWEQKVN